MSVSRPETRTRRVRAGRRARDVTRRAARYTAAGQPSVRACRSRASWGCSSRPSRAASRPASRSSSASSSTPISSIRPLARRRATGSPASRAPGDRHRHAARQVVDDHRQDVDRRRAGQEVDVVEHEHHRPPGLVERRRQPRDGVRQRRAGVQRRPGEDRPVEVEGTFDREADVAQEPDRVGVGGVAGDPADGPPLLRPPQREARRLAVARRGDHGHEAGIGPQQLPQQPVARPRWPAAGTGRRASPPPAAPARRPPARAATRSRHRPRRCPASQAHGWLPLPPVAQRAPIGHRPVANPTPRRGGSRVAGSDP